MSDLPATPPTNSPSEPLVTVGTVTAVIAGAITFGAALGFKLSVQQTAAILGSVATLAPLVVAIVGRRKVFAPDTVRAMVLNAKSRLG